MPTLSERTSQSVALATRPVHVVANPVQRGPVVLATDGTSHTGAPAVAARLIADGLGLPIEIISVLEPLPTFTVSADGIPIVNPAIDTARDEGRKASVRDYIERFAHGAPVPTIHVRLGNVATEVARFAHERSATIVVMGSAPHRRFHHTVSGERAAQVVHAAGCPVFSVPPAFSALPGSIVAAVDFGRSSLRAVQAALLVVADGGTLILTHVVPPPVRPSWLTIVTNEELALDINALFAELRDDIGPAIRDGVTVETRIIAGETVDGLLSLASHVGAEVVAAGTHGPGRLAQLFLGGVATGLLHGAEQAVLLAPAPPAAEGV